MVTAMVDLISPHTEEKYTSSTILLLLYVPKNESATLLALP
jgi:hypothetical protein